MERVPLDIFIDFIFTTGTKRIALVKRFKEARYAPEIRDFYLPLRQGISTATAGRVDPCAALDNVLADIKDGRKLALYPALITAFKAWWMPACRTTYVSSATMPVGDLEIAITPDLGMSLQGFDYLISLHFDATLPRRRSQIILAMMSAALQPMRRTRTIFGVLDVPHGRLHTLDKPTEVRLGLLLRGEAAAFSTIYAAI